MIVVRAHVDQPADELLGACGLTCVKILPVQMEKRRIPRCTRVVIVGGNDKFCKFSRVKPLSWPNLRIS